MINQQLLDYIQKQRAAGFSKQDIIASLNTAGLLTADINAAFVQIEQTSFPPAPPVIQPQSALHSKSASINPLNNSSSSSSIAPIQSARKPVFVKILIAAGALLILGGGTYAYFMNIGPFSRPPYTEANLVSGIAKAIARIDTSSYLLSASLGVEKRADNAKPFVIHTSDTTDMRKQYQNDAVRAQNIGSLLSSLQTHAAPYPSSLQTLVDESNKKHCSLQTGERKTRCLLSPSSFYGNLTINDPVSGRSYEYSVTEAGKNFALTVTFETDNAITSLRRSYQFTPETTIIEGKRVTFTNKSTQYFFLPSEPPKPTLVQLSESMSYMPAEMSGSMGVSGQTDWRSQESADWTFNINAKGDFGDLSYKMDIDALKKDGIYYLKINNIPSLFFGFLSAIKGKWVKVDPRTASSSQDTSYDVFSSIASQLPQAEKSYKESRKEIARVLEKAIEIAEQEKLFILKNAPHSERVDGRTLYRYDLTLRKDAIAPFYKRLRQEVSATKVFRNYRMVIDEGYEQYLQSPEFKDIFDYYDKNTSLTLWADSQGFPAVLTYGLRVVPPDSAIQLKEKQMMVTLKFALSNINKPITIEAPGSAKPINEVFNTNDSTNPLFQARMKSRDARRFADIKQIQLAVELYHDSCGQYPRQDNQPLALTSGATGGGSTFLKIFNGCSKGTTMASFFPTIPANPTPGGSDYTYCSVSDASKTECSKANNGTKSYIMTFTLEDTVSGFSAGKHIVTPNGIK